MDVSRNFKGGKEKTNGGEIGGESEGKKLKTHDEK